MRVLLICLLLLVAPGTLSAQHCTKGKPCGNSCIVQNKTCHVGSGTATRATPSITSTPRYPATSTVAPVTSPPVIVGTLGPWVASSRGHVYYWKSCSPARQLAVANRRYFRSQDEAEQAGYRRSTTSGC